jgi:hypothetical protein
VARERCRMPHLLLCEVGCPQLLCGEHAIHERAVLVHNTARVVARCARIWARQADVGHGRSTRPSLQPLR